VRVIAPALALTSSCALHPPLVELPVESHFEDDRLVVTCPRRPEACIAEIERQCRGDYAIMADISHSTMLPPPPYTFWVILHHG
jgi:hypothetical protein